MDKRLFHNYLNNLKDERPDDFALIESIQETFEKSIDTITDSQRKALRNHPIQFIERIPQDDGGWTTNLHIWGENCVEELLEVDPMILSHKNGYGDTVLMSMIVGATGAHTETVNHKLIQRILEKNMEFEDIEKVDGNDEITLKNVLDITDLNGQSILDYLIDFAFATGAYEGQEPDEKLQMLLRYFAEMHNDEGEEDPIEKVIIVHEDELTEEPESEETPKEPESTESEEDELEEPEVERPEEDTPNSDQGKLSLENLDLKRYID